MRYRDPAACRFGQHLGSLFVSTRLATESVAREKAKFEALVGNALTYLDKTEASKPPAAARSRRRLSESNLSAAGMCVRLARGGRACVLPELARLRDCDVCLVKRM